MKKVMSFEKYCSKYIHIYEKFVDESLIHTYPLSNLQKGIVSFIGNTSYRARYRSDEFLNVFEIIAPVEIVKSINVLSNIADLRGYFIAQVVLVNANDDKFPHKKIEKQFLLDEVDNTDSYACHIMFESKFDVEVKVIPKIIYHVTLSKYVHKIRKIGLVPRAKYKLAYHTERIYFATTLEYAKEFMNYAAEIENKSENDYTILEIKTDGLKNKFMQDPNFSDVNEVKAIYTHENINPKYIS